MQLDHLFIRASPGAPEAELLRRFGLTEGTGNRHPGQGTQNRRFFLQNAFIELLWIADAQEVHGAQTRPTLLGERLQVDAPAVVSPFGVSSPRRSMHRLHQPRRPPPRPAWSRCRPARAT